MKAGPGTELTERARGGGIILRHPRWAEFDDWVNLRRDNRAYLSPWEPQWTPEHLTRPAYKARLARFKKLVANETGYPFHIFRARDDKIVGACNIVEIRRHVAQSAQIGYWLGEEYSGNGFARAAVRAAMKFCFQDLGLHRVEAAVQPDNARSVRLLEATGFQKEGTARGYLKINGTWQDHDLYARLSSD